MLERCVKNITDPELPIDAILAHAEAKCIKNGGRLTKKRKLVLSSLLVSQKAMSAYDLVEVCSSQFGESIPAVSVYRILEFLESQQLAHKLNSANKYVACSSITCDHSHDVPQFLICSQCQRVEEISIGNVRADVLAENAKKAGFDLVRPQLELNCICNECAN